MYIYYGRGKTCPSFCATYTSAEYISMTEEKKKAAGTEMEDYQHVECYLNTYLDQ